MFGTRGKYAVDLVPVFDVERGHDGFDLVAIYDDEADVVISPPVALESVYKLMNEPLSPRWRAPLEGERAWDLVAALAQAVRERTVLGDEELKKKIAGCDKWSRSSTNREAAILAANGMCAACDRGYGAHFGLFALDVHHRSSLGKTKGRSVSTQVDDLDVLCPTCHRLIHRLPDEASPLEALRTQLDVFLRGQ